jgi:hypothetical protein
MNKKSGLLTVEKNFGLDEQAIMALLLVLGVIQIGFAVSASAPLVRDNVPTASIMHLHHGPMFAKK